MSEHDELKNLLNDDDDLRDYFNSRDPKRKKPSPGLTEEAADQVKGKASVLTPKEDKKEVHGVSFSQHMKNISETRRRGIWVGISIGLLVAIIVTLLAQ